MRPCDTFLHKLIHNNDIVFPHAAFSHRQTSHTCGRLPHANKCDYAMVQVISDVSLVAKPSHSLFVVPSSDVGGLYQTRLECEFWGVIVIIDR